jgi:hypothetical protein
VEAEPALPHREEALTGYFEEKGTGEQPKPDLWERLGEYTYRMVVPGGWLYRYTGHQSMGMVFVPAAIFPTFAPNPTAPTIPPPVWGGGWSNTVLTGVAYNGFPDATLTVGKAPEKK